MNTGKTLIIVISPGTFILSFVTLQYLLGEITVYYEMWHTHAHSRAELGNDFGLGLLGVYIVIPASFIFSIVISALVWRLLTISNRNNRDSE